MSERCDACGYNLNPWYRVIQEVGDVLLGRRYWRDRAQKLEHEHFNEPRIGTDDIMLMPLLRERNQFHAESERFRTRNGDLENKIRFLVEALRKADVKADILDDPLVKEITSP